MTMHTITSTVKHFRFSFFAIALVLFSFANGVESNGYKYLNEIENRNRQMLTDLADIKLILSEIDTLNISLVSGKVETIKQAIDKAERVVFFSTVSSLLQRALVEVSKNGLIPLAALILILVSVLIGGSLPLKRAIVLLLMISPGLSLYSIGVHHLSQYSEEQMGHSLHTKLQAISSKLSSEKAELLQARDENEQRDSHEGRFERFLSNVESDATYEVRKVEVDIKGAFSMIRTLLRSGGKHILDDLIGYATHSVLMMILAPLLYLYCLYAFVTQYPYSPPGHFTRTVESPNRKDSSPKRVEPTLTAPESAAPESTVQAPSEPDAQPPQQDPAPGKPSPAPKQRRDAFAKTPAPGEDKKAVPVESKSRIGSTDGARKKFL